MRGYTIAAVLAVSALADKKMYESCMKDTKGDMDKCESLLKEMAPINCDEFPEHP